MKADPFIVQAKQSYWQTLLIVLATLLPTALAQVPQGRAIKGFQVAEQNPATTRQSLLTGKDAVALTRERFLIKGLRLEVKDQGKLVMLIEAPECLYDYGSRSAWSTNLILVKSGDDRLELNGEGFEWRETNAVLTISNRVEATIRRDLVQPPKTGADGAPARRPGDSPAPLQTLQVRSHQFTYLANDHRVRFTGETHVADPSLDLSCDQLTVDLPAKEGSVERIVAEGHVAIAGKEDGLKAQSDRATYVQLDDSLELSGNASWTMGQRSGRAPLIRLARQQRQLSVPKSSFLRLPVGSDLGGFLTSTNSLQQQVATSNAANDFIEIQSDSLELGETRATFLGNVEARRMQNELPTGSLMARQVVAFIGQSNRLDRLEATDNVRIREGKRQAVGNSAVYTADGIMALTGDPSWDFEQMRGRAGRIQFDTRRGRLSASPQAEVTLDIPVGDKPGLFTLGSSLQPTNATGGTRSIHVRSDSLDYSGNEALFTGSVRAEEISQTNIVGTLTAASLTVSLDPQQNTLQRIVAQDKVVVQESSTPGDHSPGRLTCERITALFEGAKAALSTVTAENHVVLEQEGSTIEAAKAVFVAGEDRVTLTGHPEVRSPQGVLRGADAVIWDRTTRKYRASGPWKLHWTPPEKAARGGAKAR